MSKETVSSVVSEKLAKAIESEATANDRTVSWVIAKILENHFKDELSGSVPENDS